MPQSRQVTAFALVAVGAALLAASMAGELRASTRGADADVVKVLASLGGDWSGSMTITRPGMAAMELPATETIVAIGDHWTASDLHCELMGRPFHAHFVLGWDSVDKQLVGTRVDSLSPQLTAMEGVYDGEEKAVRMRWVTRIPGRTETVPGRYDLKVRGDTYVMRFYEGEGASEVPTMKIEMERKVE
ncbi:MAG: DUF1579 family protein [Planctomycetota bacterium]